MRLRRVLAPPSKRRALRYHQKRERAKSVPVAVEDFLALQENKDFPQHDTYCDSDLGVTPLDSYHESLQPCTMTSDSTLGRSHGTTVHSPHGTELYIDKESVVEYQLGYRDKAPSVSSTGSLTPPYRNRPDSPHTVDGGNCLPLVMDNLLANNSHTQSVLFSSAPTLNGTISVESQTFSDKGLLNNSVCVPSSSGHTTSDRIINQHSLLYQLTDGLDNTDLQPASKEAVTQALVATKVEDITAAPQRLPDSVVSPTHRTDFVSLTPSSYQGVASKLDTKESSEFLSESDSVSTRKAYQLTLKCDNHHQEQQSAPPCSLFSNGFKSVLKMENTWTDSMEVCIIHCSYLTLDCIYKHSPLIHSSVNDHNSIEIDFFLLLQDSLCAYSVCQCILAYC